jgi:hypothetical protein
MAFKMKDSPAKRGAIIGVGPNAGSPMQLGVAGQLLKRGAKYLYKKAFGSTTKKVTSKTKTTKKKSFQGSGLSSDGTGFYTYKGKHNQPITTYTDSKGRTLNIWGEPGSYVINPTAKQTSLGLKHQNEILKEANRVAINNPSVRKNHRPFVPKSE